MLYGDIDGPSLDRPAEACDKTPSRIELTGCIAKVLLRLQIWWLAETLLRCDER